MFRSAFHLHGDCIFGKQNVNDPKGVARSLTAPFCNGCLPFVLSNSNNQEKKTPFLLVSQHRNQIRLWIRRCVRLEMKARLLGRPSNRGSSAEEVTLKGCAVFSICAIARCRSTPRQKKPWRETGKTPGIGGAGIPNPWVNELARSWSSKTSRSRTSRRAREPSKSTSTASCFTGIIQNTPLRPTCTL